MLPVSSPTYVAISFGPSPENSETYAHISNASIFFIYNVPCFDLCVKRFVERLADFRQDLSQTLSSERDITCYFALIRMQHREGENAWYLALYPKSEYRVQYSRRSLVAGPV